MALAAILALVAVFLMTVHAWRLRPAQHFLDDFAQLWTSGPWARQVIVDFYGLEIILLLWMGAHAWETGSWLAFGLCAAAMPLFGAVPAAAYWLIAVW